MRRHIFTLLLMTTQVYSQEDSEHQGPQTCGGYLKGPVGVIHTPNFPDPFPVPIKCKWIIEHDIVNGTISVYFTQQYTTSGLTFTEYMYYDESYKLDERRALTVTEENITKIKWLQVQSPVLVIELSLNRLEGTQLRALGLLSVFGFNLTYAVRGPAPAQLAGPPSCSAIECRLLGHCYARKDFQEFFCACFDGYSGPDCGVGPLCPRTLNLCKNGGTCRQLGPAAVSCVCAPGFTGDLCEAQIAPPECGTEECYGSCKRGRSCDCQPKDSDFSMARFETNIQVVGQDDVDMSRDLVEQVTSYLKASNVTLEDDVEVLNISKVERGGGARSVHLRVWCSRRAGEALRGALASLPSAARFHRLRVLPSTHNHLDTYPALFLQALIVNQRPEVWEGTEFILSCIAYGSSGIMFTWYKDGVEVNFDGTTRDIWTRTVAEDGLSRSMSMLGITEAKRLDSGIWSCAAEDVGKRRCKALRLTVLRPPDLRLVPSTLTINKGENLSITCLASAGRVHGVLGFSWARERTLLPLAPGREVWEDLYPAGSVLKLYNVQKSGEFSCQVSSVAGTNSIGTTIWTLGANDEACEAEASYGLWWPKTAPGAHAAAACPPGHSGETIRSCESKTGLHGVKWMLPDFSNCLPESLKDIYEQFIRISFGYSWGNVSSVARQYGAVLRSLPELPGAGSLPLYHCKEMLSYLLSSVSRSEDKIESVEQLLKIYDTLLKYPDAFLDEEKIYDLQDIIVKTSGMKKNMDIHLSHFIVNTKAVGDDSSAHYELHPTSSGGDWLVTSAGVELIGGSKNMTVVVVQYHNLTARLPSLKRSIEGVNGEEMQYQLASKQVQLYASGTAVDQALPHTVTLLFTHFQNYSGPGSMMSCGVRSWQEPRAWSSRACELRAPEPSRVVCRCRGLGTYALFTVVHSTLIDAENDLKNVVKITVGVSSAMCLVAAALQLLSLVSGEARLPVLLKAATAGTHSAAMLALLECDTGQEGCGVGAAGWVCAACWCAGGAALCAQPLLLHAELAARKQRASSVALLAGVSTLVCLCARVCGPAALAAGAALAAWCVGAVLLAALTLVLALCTRRALAALARKLPARPDTALYLQRRISVIRHTLVLVVTTCSVQAAGVAYAQPGERTLANVVALAATAIANGAAMVLCYVALDAQCARAVRRALAHPSRARAPPADTSLSLYIKQGADVEVQSPRSSLDTHSPQRRESPDSRADIVQCVEHKESRARHTLCDVVPVVTHAHPRPRPPLAPPLPPLAPPRPLHVILCEADFPPYTYNFEPTKEECSLCVQSNPDVSILNPPVKSCLKKNRREMTASVSMPSMEPDAKSDIALINRQWNKVYDKQDADKVLNKISHDLDFLLNRTQNDGDVTAIGQVQEAPT